MKLENLSNFPTAAEFESYGLSWHQDGYIAPECLIISQQDADAYYQAALRAYEMYCEAAQHVIDNDLFFELGIPFNLVELIKTSWENDVFWHIYGRFDFAGGLDGAPIKLLEFNANTPTCVLETGFIQYELLRRSGRDFALQFNNLFDALVSNFKRVICHEDDPENVKEIPYKMLFSCVRDAEEEVTVKFLMHAALEAGWDAEFAFIDEVELNPDEGVIYNGVNYEFFFHLLPWEIIATEEPEMLNLLTQICAKRLAVVLNPAYTLLFQSKGMLKILSDLFPDEQMILKADFAPLDGIKQVKKPFFGREGANVSIIDEFGNLEHAKEGDYSNDKFIYQEFTHLNNLEGQNYQAGVFFAYEPCALGFRREAGIIANRASFVTHSFGS